jgi:hypothetical protein
MGGPFETLLIKLQCAPSDFAAADLLTSCRQSTIDCV